MLRRLRRFLADSDAREQRVLGELRMIEECLSRRMSVIEQRLAENEQVLRRLGHQVARIDGRTSIMRAAAPVLGKSSGIRGREPETQRRSS